ncbi:MAG TPA: ABC transporter substrate-binding protein [Ramlibacter sp.]|nr:ABC transporter substrate-binding protein [Ramlibacter sp.]
MFQGTRVSRRSAVALIAAAPLAGWAKSPSIRICQSTALSGPLGELGSAMHQGAKACFAGVNAQGGIHGTLIDLQTRDDGYDVARAAKNVDEFLADPECFALFNCMGTPMIASALPKVLASGMPFFAPFSGALSIRPAERSVVHIRASYPDEAEQLVQHLATVGIKRIGVAYQNNSFGKEVLDGVKAATDRHKLASPSAVTVENDASDAARAASQLAAANPEAVVLGLAGKPAMEFVKSIRAERRGLPLYGLSVLATTATLRALGENGVGLTLSQVMPSPRNAVVPLVRDFLQAWKSAGMEVEPSHLGLEGYVNARVFCEALKRAGRNPTRGGFLDAVWKMKALDLGGFNLAFTAPGKNASRFVELTMVGRDARFIR